MLDFEKLQALAKMVTSPEAPLFYKRHYGANAPLQIENHAAWQALQPVTKDDLIAMPLAQRSFLPLRELDHLRTSSGTSGKAPLFSPRTHVRGMDYRLRFHDFKKPFLAFSVPMMPHWHERFQEEHGIPPQVIVYDPRNPSVSVRLAKAAGVDAFSIFVYHAQTLGECMKKEGINAHIRFAEVTGELCTRAQYEYLRATFPNATIVQSYGASEIEDVHIGMPCRAMDGTEPLAVYHPKASHYLEIRDPETGRILEPKKGVEGDLLITAYPGEPSAFPMLRFRIGDTIRIVEESCKAHGAWTFTVVGRTDMDFMKIPGGVLRSDEMTRVVQQFQDRISPNFALHRFDRETDTGPKVQIELHVEPNASCNLEELAHDIAAVFRVNPSRTYADGVRDGMYLPLVCTAMADGGAPGKTRRLIAH